MCVVYGYMCVIYTYFLCVKKLTFYVLMSRTLSGVYGKYVDGTEPNTAVYTKAAPQAIMFLGEKMKKLRNQMKKAEALSVK